MRVISKKLRDSAKGRSKDPLNWKSGRPYDQIRADREKALKEDINRIIIKYNAETLKGYSSYYITPCGKVYSTNGTKLSLLRPGTKKHGYRFVGLTSDLSERKYEMVHRLAANQFIPNLENKPAVNHKNGNKSDNRVENLEWCTHSENSAHAIRTGLAPSGLNSYKSKLNKKQIVEIYYAKESYSKIGRRYNVCAQTVCNIKNKQTYKKELKGIEPC